MMRDRNAGHDESMHRINGVRARGGETGLGTVPRRYSDRDIWVVIADDKMPGHNPPRAVLAVLPEASPQPPAWARVIRIQSAGKAKSTGPSGKPVPSRHR